MAVKIKKVVKRSGGGVQMSSKEKSYAKKMNAANDKKYGKGMKKKVTAGAAKKACSKK